MLLNQKISEVCEEEGSRIGLVLRSREKGGVSLARQLVRSDLRSGEPCGWPGCVLDRISGGGLEALTTLRLQSTREPATSAA